MTEAAPPIDEAEAAALFLSLERASGIILAVSGGADSMALLTLAARWAGRPGRPPLRVVTVDHARREGSAEEADLVGHQSEALGVPAETHRLSGDIGADHAALRDARYAALIEAARRHGASHIATAHHREDQAETVLIRLARGSGLRGLRGMLPERIGADDEAGTVTLARPFLGTPSARLRATCEALDQPWHEDPSNADPRYARGQIRALRPALDGLGLTTDRLVRTAAGMSRVNDALDHYVREALADLRLTDVGLVGLPHARFDAPEEVSRRILEAMLDIVRGGQAYPPRLEPALHLGAWLRSGSAGRRVLQGCVVTARRRDAMVTVHREWGRHGPRPLRLAPGERGTFDGRYVVSGRKVGTLVIAAAASEGSEQLTGDWPPRPDWVSPRAWREACGAAPIWLDGERPALLRRVIAADAPFIAHDRVAAAAARYHDG